MRWTTAAELRAQLLKMWDRGELLAALATGQAAFPKRLALKAPSSGEMADRFDEVRSWIAELRALSHLRVEMREFRHRIFGANSVPHEVWVDSLEQALAVIGKQRSGGIFARLVEATRLREPRLLEWLARRPLRALELAGEWERLLAVVGWVENHPRPAVYLRQVDLPGVHTKFMEAHRGVLSELLDLVLPTGSFDETVSGVGRFALRYGFLDKPARVRFRFLDAELAPPPCLSRHDITLDAESFARLEPPAARVFITENEINFLAFPPVKGSLVVFGAGYGFEMLEGARWISRCRLYYWGDIDTHGFAILDQLRDVFPHAESFLMDRETLLAFRSEWVEEEKPARRDLPRLSPVEGALYDDLRDNRLGNKVRLEQERVGFRWVESALADADFLDPVGIC